MWWGKRWNIAKENTSKEAEEDKSAGSVTDSQTDRQKVGQTDRQTERTILLCTVSNYSPQHCYTKQTQSTCRNKLNSRRWTRLALNIYSDQLSHNILSNITSRIHSIHSYPFRCYERKSCPTKSRSSRRFRRLLERKLNHTILPFSTLTFQTFNAKTACCHFTKRLLAVGMNTAVMRYNAQL